MIIKFTVPGFPRGKGRARSFGKQLKSGKIITGQYADEKTVNYEAFIKGQFVQAYPSFTPIDGPVEMVVEAYFPIPKSASKAKREQMILGYIRPTRKPDLSNIEKAIEDGLNGVAYMDDSQVVDRIGHKWYAEFQPRVEVQIMKIVPFGQ